MYSVIQKANLSLILLEYSNGSHLESQIGNHINVKTGAWTAHDAGIGAGVDSYFEYLLKGGVLLQNLEYLNQLSGVSSSCYPNVPHTMSLHQSRSYIRMYQYLVSTCFLLFNQT